MICVFQQSLTPMPEKGMGGVAKRLLPKVLTGQRLGSSTAFDARVTVTPETTTMHRKLLLLARGLALAVFATLAMSLAGCGPTQTDVTGKVTYNGAPLAKPNGQIVFANSEGAQVGAPINEDGTYKAIKVTAGLNRVAVYYPNPAFKVVARPKGVPKERPTIAPMYLTPEKYSTVETSDLSVTVEKGTVFNVDMTGPAIP